MRCKLLILMLFLVSASGIDASTQPTLFGWGSNQYGQVGTDAPSASQPRPIPIRLSNLHDVRPCAYHALAVLTDGTVLGWGRNQHGQANTVPGGDVHQPTRVLGLGPGAAVRCGGFHSLVLTAQGDVLSWGLNRDGELGTGDNVNYPTPQRILTNIVSIAAKGRNSVAVHSSGTVYAWGKNDQGQLGNGTTVSANTPTPVSISAGIVAVAPAWRTCSHSTLLEMSGRGATTRRGRSEMEPGSPAWCRLWSLASRTSG